MEILLHTLSIKYYETNRLQNLIEKFKLTNIKSRLRSKLSSFDDSFPNSKKSSRNVSKENLFPRNSLDNLARGNITVPAGRYRKILELFMNDGDSQMNAFDAAFPGLWNHESASHTYKGSDAAVIISVLITEFLNILTSIGICLFIALDDFQVYPSNFLNTLINFFCSGWTQTV